MFASTKLAILGQPDSDRKHHFVFQLAEALLKKETLRYEEVEELLGPPPHGRKNVVDFGEFEQSVSQAGQETPSNQTEPELERDPSRDNASS